MGDLTKLRWKDLTGCRGVVRKTVEEVEKVLSGMGLSLKKGE